MRFLIWDSEGAGVVLAGRRPGQLAAGDTTVGAAPPWCAAYLGAMLDLAMLRDKYLAPRPKNPTEPGTET
jgi:hypothetical protein